MANEVAKKTLANKEEPVIEDKVTTEEKKHTESVPYERFAEMVSARKEAEAKLSELTKAQEKAAEEKALELAKKEGDYTKLAEKLQKQEKAMKIKAADMVKQTVGAKLGILKPEYTKLLEVDIKVSDDLEIENVKDVEKAMEDFKKSNPSLFGDGTKPKVPSTDSSKPSGHKIAEDEMSTADKLRYGMEERLSKLDSLHKFNIGAK